MTDGELSRYQMAERVYDKEFTQYQAKKKALNSFKQEISQTIYRRHLYLIRDKRSAYRKLKKLKEYLCPITIKWERQLAARY